MACKPPNKLTEGANVLHESSRMMLPEHKERFVTGVVQAVDQQLQRVKIDTGEDEWEWVFFKDIMGTV